MVFGGVASERLQLNEATLWSGGPRDWNNPGAREVLPEVRAAVFAGDFVKATELAKKMQGPYNQSYQPLGDLRLRFGGEAAGRPRPTSAASTSTGRSPPSATGSGEATFTREVFSSFPDQVIVVRLDLRSARAHRASALSADSPLRYAVQTDGGHTLVLRGRAPAHVDPSYLGSKDPIRYDDGPDPEGMTFDLRVRVLAEGGSVTSGGSTLTVTKADAVTLLALRGHELQRARTSRRDAPAAMRRPRRCARSRPRRRWPTPTSWRATSRTISDSSGASPSISARPPGAADLTTDARLDRFVKGEADPGLATLLYQYGRYLLIASSRPGGPPANLQGIWNESMRPPWSSNWTLNINTEMNYWPAEVANLAECHEPLLAFIEALAVERPAHRRGQLRRARLGGASQRRPLGPDRAGRELRRRRPQVGELAHERRLAQHPPLGALRVRTGPSVPARARLAGHEGAPPSSASTG